VKICGGGRGRLVIDVVVEEDVLDRIRRLGRGMMGRVVMREDGSGEDVDGGWYCWGWWIAGPADGMGRCYFQYR